MANHLKNKHQDLIKSDHRGKNKDTLIKKDSRSTPVSKH